MITSQVIHNSVIEKCNVRALYAYSSASVDMQQCIIQDTISAEYAKREWRAISLPFYGFAKTADAVFQKAQSGLVIGRSLTKIGLLNVDLNGVAVKRAIERNAVAHTVVGLLFKRREMLFMGRGDVLALGFFEHGFEVQLFGFVIGCVRIGDIARQDFHALTANAQSTLVDAKCVG